MIIGIMSDAHGNIFGLKDCFLLLQKFQADQIYFLGDAVNYFGKSKEVLHFLKNHNISCIKGNHEIALIEKKELSLQVKEVYNIDHTLKTLDKEDYEQIKSWKDFIEITYNNVRILMVHGSPFNHSEGYVYPDTNLENFHDVDHDMIFMGHTHIPFIKEMDNKFIVNVGSVGFLRDDGRYLSCTIVDTIKNSIQILRKDFPSEKITELKPFHKDISNVLERRREK